MDDYKKLADKMKKDWDRRVKHDYRFWMGDGYQDDDSMWKTGERDFLILCEDLKDTADKTMLDLGCGVGRLLRAAASRFAGVKGLDVSEIAVNKGRELLKDLKNAELLLGNGYDLSPLENDSIDVAISYAAISSIPLHVTANYLREIKRVLKKDGEVRLQLYFGKYQQVTESDTLHLRCFPQDSFEKAIQLAGFKLDRVEEIRLPFEVSDPDAGFTAVKVRLTNTASPAAPAELILKTLTPSEEVSQEAALGENDLEYWMSLNYANELADQGEYEKAEQALEYAGVFSKTVAIDVRDLWNSIVKKIEENKGGISDGAVQTKGTIFDVNTGILARRFPELATRIAGRLQNDDGNIEIQSTEQGTVVYVRGQCQDHATKPASSARVWVERCLNEDRLKQAGRIVVYGFGSGYHLEELFKQTDRKISVIEPELNLLIAVMQKRDLTEVLSRIDSIQIGQEQEPAVRSGDELLIRPQAQVGSADFLSKVKPAFYSVQGIETLTPRIAVLGPVQGGTLPILGYTARSLAMEKQRVREIDVSGFAGGYHAINGLLNNEMIQQSAQGTYIQMLSKMVLDSITEKPIDILICMAQNPLVPEALTEIRNKGIITVLWFVEDYMRFTAWKSLAPYYDFIFTIQKGDCIEQIKNAGCPEVHYLPTACDPLVHMPLQLTKEEKNRWGSPVSFMGAGYHNRQQVFASLAGLPFKIWGTEWPGCKPFDALVQEKGRRLSPEEYVKIFNGTDINLNLHSSTERDGVDPNGDFINPRTFELAGMGAFQLVDERALLPELFEPGKEIVTFKDVQDMKAKIDYYLEHEDERKEIAARGRERVFKEHLYQHRIKDMLSIVYKSRFEQLKKRQEEDPWTRMIQRAKSFPELEERCKRAYQRGEEPILDGLVADIMTGEGSLSDTEQKLLFLFHVTKQIIRMKKEEMGGKGVGAGES